MVNWSAHTKRTLPFIVTTQHKTRARKAPIDAAKGTQARRRLKRVLMIGKACRRKRRISMIGKARRREDEQGAKNIKLPESLPTSAELPSFYAIADLQCISIVSYGAVVQWLSLLHNFIQQSLKSSFAQVQILLTGCWKLAMVRITDNGAG